MQKEFIPYEEAVELKKLGFNEPCFAYYDICDAYTKGYAFCYFNQGSQDLELGCLAPTYSQAFRWSREKHECYANLSSWLHEEEIGTYHEFEIYGTNQYAHGSVQFKTYEEAELECLKKLIEIVKNK